MRKLAFSVPLTALVLAPAAARLGLPAAAAALAFAPARALASCAAPHPFVAPATGARLPPSPTLYVFRPAAAATETPAPVVETTGPGGAPLAHRFAQVSQSGNVRVYRLDIDSGEAPRVNVKVTLDTGPWAAPPVEGRYLIDQARAQPDRSALEMVGAKEQVSRRRGAAGRSAPTARPSVRRRPGRSSRRGGD